MNISYADYNIVINGLCKQLELYNKFQQEQSELIALLRDSNERDKEAYADAAKTNRELRELDQKELQAKEVLIQKLDASVTRCQKCGKRIVLSVGHSVWVHLDDDLTVSATPCKAVLHRK